MQRKAVHYLFIRKISDADSAIFNKIRPLGGRAVSLEILRYCIVKEISISYCIRKYWCQSLLLFLIINEEKYLESSVYAKQHLDIELLQEGGGGGLKS